LRSVLERSHVVLDPAVKLVYLGQYIAQSVELGRVLSFLLALVAKALNLSLHVILNFVKSLHWPLREATSEGWPLALLDACSELLVLLSGLLLLLYEGLKTLALPLLFFLSFSFLLPLLLLFALLS